MRQVVQEVQGNTSVREVPAPISEPHHLIVANVASLVSAGTERYVVELARKSLVAKARARPDHVKRVLQKMRQEGMITTLQQVRAKLAEPMPLGYSSAGVVLECGRGVTQFKPGDRVACVAPHAGVVSVGENLATPIPEGVGFDQAAYGAVGAIALQGVRLARVSLGERVLVIGLGLIGQITVQLLKAQGCRVMGTDLDQARIASAKLLGIDVAVVGSPVETLRSFAGNEGVDAVVITAATSSNQPIEFAAEVVRVKGRIVLVGVVGLNLPRAPFFAKEIEFVVSSSLGPGRSDSRYEDSGQDYPYGHVRWTAQRNIAAVLDLMAEQKLDVKRLTSHRFPIERAAEAYDVITERTDALGIVIDYEPPRVPLVRRVDLPRTNRRHGGLGLSVIGAGNFARLVMLPELAKIGTKQLRGICSAGGMSAEFEAARRGFAFCTSDAEEVIQDPETSAVFIATRHDLHAELVISGLRAGKHVFVEKPLCIQLADLARIRDCVEDLGESCPILMVGYNRRFALGTAQLRDFFAGIRPLSLNYRFAVPALPSEHWVHHPDVGGTRLVGEACHAIDACVHLAGSAPTRVFAESAAKVGDAQVSEDRAFVTLRHANGCVSCVSYVAGADRGMPAERIEVFGGGRSAVLDGWRELELWQNGRVERRKLDGDRGHARQFAAFVSACTAGGSSPIPWAELHSSTEASLLALESLHDGCAKPMEENA